MGGPIPDSSDKEFRNLVIIQLLMALAIICIPILLFFL